ncbi:BTB domain-containing protein [Mycena venus]|uniref:BTB domain-containing protein n=1 Tax=Mycena venus TaxID=2733690 RepID=A0A8H6YJJ3_9AGAR|nr:BTB domain-containing protein [Mycena venus]
MSTPPAAKRKRGENAPITRSHIWYQDGSLVLQAGQHQFRVHWGVVSEHSSFFRDMQALPQPPDQPTVDGCPVVELSDDLMDVEFLLKALYTPVAAIARTFLAQTALPLHVIGALLKLGKKYDFRALLDSAVARLTFEYPATLEEYDRLLCDDAPEYTPTRIVPYDALEFDVISLARESDIVSVLPSAYYRLVLTSYSMASREMTGLWLLSHQLTYDGASEVAKNSHMLK